MKINPKVMYFQDWTFHPGLNLTVRRGIEWAIGGKGLVEAQHVWQKVPKTYLKIKDIRIIPFVDLPSAWVMYSHSIPDLRSLYRHMTALYEHFDPHEIVTCVFFELATEEDINRAKKPSKKKALGSPKA